MKTAGSAASTAARATPCSTWTPGANGTRARHSTTRCLGRQRRRQRPVLSRLLSDPYFDRAPPKEHRPRLVPCSLARPDPGRIDGVRSAAGGCPGHIGRTHGAQRRAGSVAACTAECRTHAGVRWRRPEPAPDAATAIASAVIAGPAHRRGGPSGLAGRSGSIAWLAQAHLEHLPGNRPEVTGAQARESSGLSTQGADQTEKLEPQPQVVVAFQIADDEAAP